MSASDYAKTKLFGPLGIGVSNWWRDPQGISIGGFGLALLPRDMAKFGYLYLRGGQWEDNALLSPAWIDKVNHATVNMNLPRTPDLRYSICSGRFPTSTSTWRTAIIASSSWSCPGLDIVAVTTAGIFARSANWRI